MRVNFDLIMTWLAVYEGGKVDHKKDPGGRTNRGVIQRVYNGYRQANGLSLKDVWEMSDDEHDDIYIEQYWRPVWGDRLPSGVDAAVFDYAVNSGVSRAVKVLQKCVGVQADGIMGNVTLGAVLDYCKRRSAGELVIAICTERMAFLKRLTVWPTFKGGWTRRVIGEHTGVQDDDIGVIDRAVRLSRNNPGVIPLPKGPVPGKAQGPVHVSILEAIMAIIAALFGRNVS